LIDPGTSTLRQIKGFRCATGRWVHPRIGMLRALNRNVEREFDSARKDTALGTAQAGARPNRTKEKADRRSIRAAFSWGTESRAYVSLTNA